MKNIDKKTIVSIIAGIIIGITSASFGIFVSNPLWWYINLPLITLASVFGVEIWDFFNFQEK